MALLQVVTAALFALAAGTITAVVEFGLILLALLFVSCNTYYSVIPTPLAATARPSSAPRCGSRDRPLFDHTLSSLFPAGLRLASSAPVSVGACHSPSNPGRRRRHAPSAAATRRGQKPPNTGYVEVKARPVDADLGLHTLGLKHDEDEQSLRTRRYNVPAGRERLDYNDGSRLEKAMQCLTSDETKCLICIVDLLNALFLPLIPNLEAMSEQQLFRVYTPGEDRDKARSLFAAKRRITDGVPVRMQHAAEMVGFVAEKRRPELSIGSGGQRGQGGQGGRGGRGGRTSGVSDTTAYSTLRPGVMVWGCTRPAELCRTISRLATRLEDTQQQHKEVMFQRFLTQYEAREKSEYTAHRLGRELDEARAWPPAAEQRRLVDPRSRATFISLYEQIETMDMRNVELEDALEEMRKAHARGNEDQQVYEKAKNAMRQAI
ncbi:hypothetical protein G6O67_007867 [Ophiocordyceps sinensis]|uniref:Uncharacterized protein n=2 Tax=Ophiocordyceps sinensis TaxID=72228 RepID=A0A8H4PJV8_9HYPO|nr:hypothetical protein OCS_03457 [Ophiocordyceps sinensis CO18]KAF4504416.1 hypothetical protein G6O67_007867 [Ophiocordyceps sinensis]